MIGEADKLAGFAVDGRHRPSLARQAVSFVVKATNARFTADMRAMAHAIMYAMRLWLMIGALICTSAPMGTKYVAAMAV